MMEWLLELDEQIFFLINRTWSAQVLDVFLVPIRDKLFWIPLYVFLLGFIFFNLEKKRVIYAILLIAATMTLADTMSSKIIKPAVSRDRPCNNWQLDELVIERARCGNGKSFTSSHATNHFALATVLYYLFAGIMRWRWILFVWAGLISYAQVYVGVHYPLDVLCGAILGLLLAYLVCLIGSLLWNRLASIVGEPNPDP